jgi:phenylpyruvate tautomerase PptA (4-oxalocrotonate tautomerase family)
MPLYTISTQAGALDEAGKKTLATAITDFHAEVSGVPANWIHVIFHDVPVGNGFTAGEVAPVVGLTVLIRTGRPPEYKRALLQRLWDLLQAATGVSDDQIVIGIQEVPPSQAMEMGQIMPEVE